MGSKRCILRLISFKSNHLRRSIIEKTMQQTNGLDCADSGQYNGESVSASKAAPGRDQHANAIANRLLEPGHCTGGIGGGKEEGRTARAVTGTRHR